MDPGPGRGLGLAPVVRVHRAALDLVALRGLHPVVRAAPHPVGKVELTAPAGLPLVVRADLHLVHRAELGPVVLDRVDLHLAVRVARADTDPGHLAVRLDLTVAKVGLARVVPVELGLAVPVDLDPVDLDPVGLAVQVDTDPAAQVDPVGLADLPDLADPAGRADPVGLAVLMMDPVGRVDPGDQVDHRRRLMCSMAPSIGVARSSAVRGTRRTASARPIMVLRHRRGSAGSVGTTGLRPGVLRRTGTGRRPPVAGTVRRLPVVGTRDGTVRAAT